MNKNDPPDNKEYETKKYAAEFFNALNELSKKLGPFDEEIFNIGDSDLDET